MSRGYFAAALLLGAAFALVLLAEDAEAATASVTISGNRFTPQTIEIRAGDSIRFTNNDGAPHTATSTGSWDSGTIGANGGEATVNIAQTGTYSYVCRFHSGMSGTVRVIARSTENAPPSVSITSPPGGASVTGIAVVSGVATDADNDVLAVTIRIDAGAWQPASVSGSTWNFAWDTRSLSNGPHSITARASDSRIAAISPSSSLEVYNAPTITLLTPRGNASAPLGAHVTFTGTATSAPNAPLAIEMSIDGGDWIPASGSTQWSYNWNTSDAELGEHNVQARAGDGTTHARSPIMNLTLTDTPLVALNEPPVITLFSPANGAYVAGLVNLTGNATDPDGPLPVVEVNVLGSGWRNVSGRAGPAWWYHWIPEGVPPGPVSFEVRASDANATISTTRQMRLAADPPPLDITTRDDAREGSPLRIDVRTSAPSSLQLAGARVLMLSTSGALLHERTTNATGVALLPGVVAGNYTVRAYAPGAVSSVPLVVKPRYEVTAQPTAFHFVDLTVIHIHVASGTGVSGVPVELRGDILPGGSTEIHSTGREGNTSFVSQPLTAGELAVYVSGNDTGVRIRVLPTILASWSPDPPAPAEDVRLHFTLNDRASSPAAGARVVVDLPGEASQEFVADANGDVVVRSLSPGTARLEVSLDGLRDSTYHFAIRTPPGAADLRDLAIRPSAGMIEVGAIVENIGGGSGTFYVDALAVRRGGSSKAFEGAALQRTFTTPTLAPGAHELASFRLPVGPGEYQISITVRNSTASLAGTVVVLDDGLPPRIEPIYDLSVPTPDDQAKTPGLGTLGIVLAAAIGLALRLGTRRTPRP